MYYLKNRMYNEQKRKAEGPDNQLNTKTVKIDVEDSQSKASMVMGLLFTKKKSKGKDGLYQFVIWRENIRTQQFSVTLFM